MIFFLCLEGDGSLCAGLHTPRSSPAEVADVDEILEHLDGSDRTGLLADTAEGTERRMDGDLSVLSCRKGLLGTAQAVSLLTLAADDRAIDAGLVQICNFDPGLVVIDFSRMEEGTGCLTPPAARTFADVNFDRHEERSHNRYDLETDRCYSSSLMSSRRN